MVDIQALSQAALATFCVIGGAGTVVVLVRDNTIQRQRKHIKELEDRLEEITVKRLDEAFEYADLMFSTSKKTEEEMAKKDKTIAELCEGLATRDTEICNLRHRIKQLEKGQAAK